MWMTPLGLIGESVAVVMLTGLSGVVPGDVGDRATLPIRAAAFVGSIAGFSLHPDGKSFLRPGVVSLFDGQIGECEQQREFVRRDEFAQDAQVLLPHVPPPSPSR